MKLVDKVIATARCEIGYHEGKVNGHWNNNQKYSTQVPGLAWSNFQPWCCTFVSWVAMTAGASALYPRTASCDAAGAWFKSKGRWSEYPAIGAQAFYGSARNLEHTGIVVDYDADYILTVEGNTNQTGSPEGDGVYLKKRLRRSANVVGYGYPAFPGGIKSADPAWASGFKDKAHVKPAPPAPMPGKTARIDGIDLSNHNVGITLSGLQAAKAHGVRFVIHKATEGTGFVDVQYRTRRRLCDQVGLPFGAYHFARPAVSSGTAQAKQYLRVAQLREGDVLPVLDLEDTGGKNLSQLTTWVADFVAECERQLGHRGGILYTRFNLGQTFGWKLWVARYSAAMSEPVTPHPWAHWDMWQFSDGKFGRPATVPGIGPCDITTLAWKPTGMAGRLRLPKKKPAPAPPPSGPPPAPTPAAAATFRNIQCNVQQTDPKDVAIKHICEVMPQADLIGWNELGTPALVNTVKAMAGWASYGPTTAAAAVAISWRTDVFELVDSGSIVVHAGILHITPTRVINWVRLRHKATGAVFTRINTQVVHHIEAAGLPRVTGAILGQNARGKVHFQVLYDLIAASTKFGPVLTGGDLNVDYLAEKRLAPSQRCPWFPYTLLGKVATFVMPDHGTHGGRAIDWTMTSGNLPVVSQTVLPHGSSDHNPVLTVFAL